MSDITDTAAKPIDFIAPFESSLLPDSGPLARIHTLENEIEAQVLHDVLASAAIPHSVDCHRDMAYDGLFQAVRGWGSIIVREEDVEAAQLLITRALKELLEQ